MLRGIDISNWQSDLEADAVFPHIDFVICKATEGNYYVDKYCDPWIQWCISNDKPWGFYHFAGSGSAAEEAAFFYDNCRDYFGKGIPVLDWEGTQSAEWVNMFVNIIHDQTGIWPWIYGNPWRFNNGDVEHNCGRWIASYPNVSNPGLDYDPGEPPDTDGLVCCWQYASDGRIRGYTGNVDIDHFFGNISAWRTYAGVPSSGQVNKPTSQLVLEDDKFRVTIEEK